MTDREYMPKEVKIQIAGNEWTIKFTSAASMPRKTWGDCDWKLKEIRVRDDLGAENFLDTIVHEVIHAQDERLFEAEDHVTARATEIAKALIASRRVFVTNRKSVLNKPRKTSKTSKRDSR